MRTCKMIFLVFLCCLGISLQAQEKMNLAGVYETNVKDGISSKMMYAILDFNNFAAKDFTQLFTEKTAQFKQLPEDFMNAKKLKKSFAGTTAAGFVKYREKTLFATTEELKLTNPRMEQGMILADWQSAAGAKGTCAIIVNDDNSIQFFGLTNLDYSLGPDGVIATCVEDRCLTDQPRAKGTPEGVEYYKQEYEKRFIKTVVTSCDPEIKVEFKGAEQVGQQVYVNLLITNQSPTLEFKMEMNGAESMATDHDGNTFGGITFKFGNQEGSKANCFMPKNTAVKCMVIIPANSKINKLSKVVLHTYGLSANFTNNRIQIDNIAVKQPFVVEEEGMDDTAPQPVFKTIDELAALMPEKMPKQLITITKAGVNLRKSASTTAPVAGKANVGDAFAFIAKEGTWNVGINPLTGEKVYIAQSVSKLSNTGSGVLNTVFYGSEYVNHYLNSNPSTGYEQTTTYTFWLRNGEVTGTVYATGSVNTVTMSGQMRNTSVNYKGKLHSWYIVLDEIVDVGGNLIEKIAPICISPVPNSDALYIGGKIYEAEGM